MPWAEKVLLLKAWLLVGAVRSGLRVLHLPRVQRILARLGHPVDTLVRRRLPAQRVSRLVEMASHLVPGGRHCLTRAMALELLLRRRGYATRLEIGVARDAKAKLIAHAWLRCEGEVLIGGEGAGDYVRLSPPSP